MRQLEFHPEARLDLEEIWEYIAGDSLDNADRVVAEVEVAISRAFAFPQIGHPRPDLTSRPLLFLHRYDYLIAYVADLDRLLVIAVIHGRRSPKTLAALLNRRYQ